MTVFEEYGFQQQGASYVKYHYIRTHRALDSRSLKLTVKQNGDTIEYKIQMWDSIQNKKKTITAGTKSAGIIEDTLGDLISSTDKLAVALAGV